jgi:transitional endoplasmic reticulum ATPase
LEIQTKGKPLAKDLNLDDLAKRTENFTGADLGALVNEATMLAIREHIRRSGKMDPEGLARSTVTKAHFEEAFKKVRPMKPGELDRFVGISKGFQPEVGKY